MNRMPVTEIFTEKERIVFFTHLHFPIYIYTHSIEAKYSGNSLLSFKISVNHTLEKEDIGVVALLNFLFESEKGAFFSKTKSIYLYIPCYFYPLIIFPSAVYIYLSFNRLIAMPSYATIASQYIYTINKRSN